MIKILLMPMTGLFIFIPVPAAGPLEGNRTVNTVIKPHPSGIMGLTDYNLTGRRVYGFKEGGLDQGSASR